MMHKILAVALIAVLALGLGCKPTSITGPVPIPTPLPSASPTPQPPSITFPLGVSGTRFVDALGQPVWLRGAIICCYDSYTLPHGWPLIDFTALSDISRAGGNFTHIRPSGEPFSWTTLDDILGEAGRLGIVVEVDIIDAWTLKHGVNHMWPEDGCAVTWEGPKPRHREWIRDLVGHTVSHPNVVYQVGNETFECGASAAWEEGVMFEARKVMHEMGMTRLIGSNSRFPGSADYVNVHSRDAASPPWPGDRPIAVNEVRTMTPEEYRTALALACQRDSYFHLWRGPMVPEEWERALGYMKDFSCTR